MSEPGRRGVTRGYVGALIAACTILAASLVVASWGMLSLLADSEPIETDGVPRWAAPLILAVALGALAWGLWAQSIVLLRGRRSPSWTHLLVLSVGSYLIWCVGGMAAGASVDETWLSPYAGLLVPIWAVSSLACWAVLLRRVYTDRGVPRWPWEREGDEG
ncbi:hypothetical protein [Leucobacter sp. GX24907]